MGEVFVARTPWVANPIAAVKRLRRDLAFSPKFAERFVHEAQLSVRLTHAHLVPALDAGSVDDEVYVASELVRGKDAGAIADRLRETGQGVPSAVAVRVLADLLSALAYVHGAREPDGRWLELVHRDVTPGNVLVGYDGITRLADFGLARSALTAGKELTGQNEVLGTPHFLAPEVLRGQRAERAADVYGAGVVVYRLLTGRAPLEHLPLQALFLRAQDRPADLRQLRPDLPEWLASLVQELVEPDPARRPTDAWLLARRLEQHVQNLRVLPRASIGRWLTTLFQREHDAETEEYARFLSLTILTVDPLDAGPSAVVFAHADDSQPLVISGPLPGRSDDAEYGTELDLSRAELLAAAEAEAAIAPNPSVSEPGLVAPLAPSRSEVDASSQTELDVPAPALEQLTGKRTLTDSQYAHEPIVRPLASGVLAPEIVVPPAPSPNQRVATALVSRPARERFAPTSQPPPPPELPPVPLGPPPITAEQGKSARPVLTSVLAALLLLGAAIGAGVWLSARSTSVSSGSEQQQLLARFEQIRTELENRNQANEQMPKETAALVSNAASALLRGNSAAARPPIEALERILATPAPKANR